VLSCVNGGVINSIVEFKEKIIALNIENIFLKMTSNEKVPIKSGLLISIEAIHGFI